MCSHYQGIQQAARLERYFGVRPPTQPVREDVWPGYPAAFIRATSGAGATARECLDGLFGLVPHWARDTRLGRGTYNARTETVAEKPAFRDAWHRAQHCIVPAALFFEPDWRSGRAVATGIGLASGDPMGLAGLWAAWRDPQGVTVHSFTLLTVNADDHAFMAQFHKPGEEKRTVVVLPPAHWDAWLQAPAANSHAYLQALPAEQLAVLTTQPPAGPTPRSLFD